MTLGCDDPLSERNASYADQDHLCTSILPALLLPGGIGSYITVYTMGSPKASQSPIKVTPNLIIQSLSVLTSEMVIGDCPSRTALNSYLA